MIIEIRAIVNTQLPFDIVPNDINKVKEVIRERYNNVYQKLFDSLAEKYNY